MQLQLLLLLLLLLLSTWGPVRIFLEKTYTQTFFPNLLIQRVLIDNATNKNSSGYVEGFDGDGFVSLSIVYSVSCAVDLLAPSVVALAGMKATLVLASCAYPAFIATFYVLQDWLLYSGSAVVGVGNALYWVGQARKLFKRKIYIRFLVVAAAAFLDVASTAVSAAATVDANFVVVVVVIVVGGAAAVAVVAVAVAVAIDIVVHSADDTVVASTASAAFVVVVAAAAAFLFEQCHTCARNT